MITFIKDKIFRTRQLVKNLQRDVEAMRKELGIMSTCYAHVADGPLAWSPKIQKKCREIFTLIQPRALTSCRKIRLGNNGDGGYVVPEDWKELRRVFSLGIGPDNSFDVALAEAGIRVDAYDHTIDRLPASHPNIHWHKKMVVPFEKDLAKSTISLETILGDVPVKEPVALKFDIEGWEFACLLSCPSKQLQKCRFLVGEFHGLAKSMAEMQTETLQGVLGKLATDFQVIHVHANNSGSGRFLGGIFVPDLLEICFVNKQHYRTDLNRELYPGPLDSPNVPGRSDLWLGSFQWETATDLKTNGRPEYKTEIAQKSQRE